MTLIEMTKTCKNCGYLITQWGHIKNCKKFEAEDEISKTAGIVARGMLNADKPQKQKANHTRLAQGRLGVSSTAEKEPDVEKLGTLNPTSGASGSDFDLK